MFIKHWQRWSPQQYNCRARNRVIMIMDSLYSILLLQLVLLGSSWSSSSGVTAQTPSGFVSIDCGSNATTSYYDSLGIEWTPDGTLFSSSSTMGLGGPLIGDISRTAWVDGQSNWPMYSTMRYFPDTTNHTKYCYSLPVSSGTTYLVRANFWMGQSPLYPVRNSSRISFKLLAGADFWDDVSIGFPQSAPLFWEMYTPALTSSRLDVCVAPDDATGDPPFISTLELRPLPDTLQPVEFIRKTNKSLVLSRRVDYGAAPTDGNVRYPTDIFDRIWNPSSAQPNLRTLSPVDNGIVDKPPMKVLQSSYVSEWPTGFSFNFAARPSTAYRINLYFSEIDSRVNASGQRVFDIFLNSKLIVNHMDVFALTGTLSVYELYDTFINGGSNMVLNLTKSSNSPYLPFLAALEVFQVFDDRVSSGTSPEDVSAIDDIKSSMGLSSYTGDPCLPVNYGYPWVQCTAVTPFRITSLSLSNYSLDGHIPETIGTLSKLTKLLLAGNNLTGSIPDLSALSSLETLDLSNNKLNGSFPESLSTLTNLKSLYLQNNNLSGQIPIALLQRRDASTLQFDFSGNPLLCQNNNIPCQFSLSPSNSYSSNSNKKAKNNHVGVIIGVVAGALLAIGGIGLIIFAKRRKPIKREHQQQISPTYAVGRTAIREASNLAQSFTYEDIVTATQNFRVELGRGGFGRVYEGQLPSGCTVAIKVASKDSSQGSKEFLNEVGLLSRVHHKNLVRLLGYCIERQGLLVLVYEFMPKGSLFNCLHGPISKVTPLSWIQRLTILVDAAQGLDYLHHGCNPQIIHRDVKSSNILLNDHLGAKIADFGISRNCLSGAEEAPATTMMGSIGYMDPEYISSAKLTEKVDVYSFGVLLFEVTSGRNVILNAGDQEKQVHVVEWARPLIECGMIEEVVDEKVGGSYEVSSVWRVLEAAMQCTQFESSQRPRMSELVLNLKEALQMELELLGSDKPSQDDYGLLSDFLHPR